MEFQRRSKWWSAGNAAVFLVSGATAFLISSPGSFRSEWGSSSVEKDRTKDDSRRQQAEFSRFEEVEQTAIQSEAETEKRLAFLQSAAERLSPEEYPAAVRAALSWPAREREAFLCAIAHRWAATDAPAACTFFATLEEPDLRITATGAALETWAGTAAKDALGWLQAQPESTLRTELIERLIRLTQEHDPALALAAFNLLPEKQRNRDRQRQLALRLAAADAHAAVLAIPIANAFDQADRDALLKIAESCVQKDLSGTLVWRKTLDGRRADEFRSALVQAWGRVNPQGALEWIKQFDGGWRPYLACSVVDGWVEKDPVSAGAYVRAMPLGEDRDLLMGTLVYKLGVQRKDIATMIALSRERAPAGDGDLQSELSNLVRDSVFDHRGVAEALRALPQEDRNRELLDGFLVSWSERNPAEVAEYIERNGLAAKTPEAAAAVTKALAGLDPERAISWATQLPGGMARDNAVTAALQQLAATDASRAWSLCEANLPLARQCEVAESVAGTLADRDSASAVEWAGRLSDQTARAHAFGSIANAWAQRNPQACIAWLGTLEAGPIRDRAIQGYISQAAFRDPQSALTWAASIGDSEQRLKQLADVASAWQSQNAREADRWISTTNSLTPSVRQWLLSTH